MTNDYFILNNMLNVPVEGQIPLHYDREALEEYLNTNLISIINIVNICLNI